MTAELGPRYQHDCDTCRFLGPEGSADLYFCPGGLLGGSLIARYGNCGREYASMAAKLVEDNIENFRDNPAQEIAALAVALDRVRHTHAT